VNRRSKGDNARRRNVGQSKQKDLRHGSSECVQEVLVAAEVRHTQLLQRYSLAERLH
jgi:hypothetical protein